MADEQLASSHNDVAVVGEGEGSDDGAEDGSGVGEGAGTDVGTNCNSFRPFCKTKTKYVQEKLF